jgi:hypothetical protein
MLLSLGQGIPIRKVILMFIFSIIPKKFAMWELMTSIVHLGIFITYIKYIGILAKQTLNKANLAP